MEKVIRHTFRNLHVSGPFSAFFFIKFCLIYTLKINTLPRIEISSSFCPLNTLNYPVKSHISSAGSFKSPLEKWRLILLIRFNSSLKPCRRFHWNDFELSDAVPYFFLFFLKKTLKNPQKREVHGLKIANVLMKFWLCSEEKDLWWEIEKICFSKVKSTEKIFDNI